MCLSCCMFEIKLTIANRCLTVANLGFLFSLTLVSLTNLSFVVSSFLADIKASLLTFYQATSHSAPQAIVTRRNPNAKQFTSNKQTNKQHQAISFKILIKNKQYNKLSNMKVVSVGTNICCYSIHSSLSEN